MNTVDLLTRTTRFALSIDAEDGDTTKRRERLLQYAQEICDDVHFRYPWAWKKASASVSVSAAGVGSLPTDFGEIGRDGGVYAGTIMLRAAVSDQPIHDYVQSGVSGERHAYSIFGMDVAGTQQIHVTTTASQTITLYYEKAPVILADVPAPTVAAEAGGVNIGAGTFSYRVTFVTATGESEGGLVSADVTTTGVQRVSLTDVPLGPTGTTSRKIYRTTNGGSVHKLQGTIANNTATTHLDDTADISLGANVPTTNTTSFGLERIPERYHFRVLIPGMRYKVLEDIDDTRAKAALAEYASGLTWMQTRERPRRETAQRMPRASIGNW